MEPTNRPRRTFEHVTELAAPPSTVFPLLCPVRESEWIEGWTCDLVYTATGIAEKGCVFVTDAPSGGGQMTWVVTAYEPPARIEFACVASDGIVQRLLVALEPAGRGTRLRWTREHTAVTPEAAAWLAGVQEEAVRARTELLFRRLAHYAETGTMLRAS